MFDNSTGMKLCLVALTVAAAAAIFFGRLNLPAALAVAALIKALVALSIKRGG